MIFPWLWVGLLGWGPIFSGSTYITNTFGTYRPHRFHTGLDLSTHGKLGIPLKALDDGTAWRIVTSYTGYGRAFYLQTKTGNIIVYAHLSRFRPDVHQWVFEQQLVQRSYFLDRFPGDTFPVHRGEVIGYSGQSGWGPPHLHLEVRTPDNRPLNPLMFLDLPDHYPPKIHAIRVVPLTTESRIEGQPWPLVQRTTHPSSPGRFHPVRVWGPFGLEIQTTDQTDGSPYEVLPYALWVGMASETLTVIRFDTLSFAEGPYSEWLFRYTGDGYSQAWIRLYVPFSDPPAPYKRWIQQFYVDTPETLWMVVQDFAGHRVKAELPLIPEAFFLSHFSTPPRWHWVGEGWKVWVGPTGVWLWSEDPTTPLFFKGECVEPVTATDSGALFFLTREGEYSWSHTPTTWTLLQLPPEGREDALYGWKIKFPQGVVVDTSWVVVFAERIEGKGELAGKSQGIALVGGEFPVIRPFHLTPPDTIGELYRIQDSLGHYAVQPRAWGVYASLQDTAPPQIRILSRQTLRVRVEDQGSGIDPNTLTVEIDQHWFPAEYEPDLRLVFAPYPLDPGAHTVQVRVQDRAGNLATRTFQIHVR